MKDIRIGNDISVRWSLYKGDEAYDLTNLPVTLYLKNAYGKKKVEGYKVEGNQVSWTFYGKDQRNTGKYSMILVVREGEQGMASTDYCDFVQLVSCACQVSGVDDENVQTETIELTSEVDFPPIIVDTSLSEVSGNPIANMAVAKAFATQAGSIKNKVDKQGNYPLLHVGTADDLAGRGESVPAEFGFRASGGKSIKDGHAYIKRIKGNSVVWNQLNTEDNAEGIIDNSNNSAYKYETLYTLPCYSSEIAGHIILAIATDKGSGVDRVYFTDNVQSNLIGGAIFTANTSANVGVIARVPAYTIANYNISLVFRDLTLMFGAGNEPTTIEEYEARKPIVEDEYAYNEGEVIHCNTESIKSVGDNAWDEQWRQGYYIEGTFLESSSQIASANPIKVLPNQEYYINQDTLFYWWFYDEDMQYVGYTYTFGGVFKVPANAKYMHFNGEPDYGTTYKNDIMIRLDHSGWKSNTGVGYEPYWQDILPLPIIRKYFPDGMMKAGTAHDEIRYNKASGKWEYSEGKIKSVDLWTLEWSTLMNNGRLYFKSTMNQLGAIEPEKLDQTKAYGICSAYEVISYLKGIDIYNGVGDKVLLLNHGYFSNVALEKDLLVIYDSSYTDVESFKAMLQEKQVKLYYESNNWEWVELDAEDQNFRDYYNVADFGTEMSQSKSNVPSAAFSADIIYQFNAVDMIREHELEITELQSIIATMQAQLASLASMANL